MQVSPRVYGATVSTRYEIQLLYIFPYLYIRTVLGYDSHFSILFIHNLYIHVSYIFLGLIHTNPSTKQSISQSVNQSISQSVNQSISQSVNQSISQSVNQSISQSVNQSISQSVYQSISQSVNQLIKQIFFERSAA